MLLFVLRISAFLYTVTHSGGKWRGAEHGEVRQPVVPQSVDVEPYLQTLVRQWLKMKLRPFMFSLESGSVVEENIGRVIVAFCRCFPARGGASDDGGSVLRGGF